MKLNNICCIGGDIFGRTICISLAYKCPEIRVIILEDEKAIPEQNLSSFSIYDPAFDQVLKKCCHRNLFFSSCYESAIKEADLIFLSVKVPIKKLTDRKQIEIDFTELEKATKLIALYAESDKIVVQKSDVPVKAAEKISWILKSTSRTGFQFSILSIPCWITEKSSIDDILNPERIVIGCQGNPSGRAAAQSLSEIYEHWIPKKNIIIVSHHSAEIYKLVAILFLAQKQCSINSIMTICEESGADLSKVLCILGKDSEVGPSFEVEKFHESVSNFIYNCECLELEETPKYWQAILSLNDFFMKRFSERIKIVLGSVEGQGITLWGASKLFMSPTLSIYEWLLKEKSKLRIYDPDLEAEQILKELKLENIDINERNAQIYTDIFVLMHKMYLSVHFKLENIDINERNVQIFTDMYLSVYDSSAIIICAKKKEFFQIDYCKLQRRMKRPLIIDRFRLFENSVMDKYGIQYFTLGSKIEDYTTPQ